MPLMLTSLEAATELLQRTRASSGSCRYLECLAACLSKDMPCRYVRRGALSIEMKALAVFMQQIFLTMHVAMLSLEFTRCGH